MVSVQRTNWIMASLLVSVFLSSLEQTIVSTALPTIVEKLGGVGQSAWVFTIYLLSSTSILPIAGKLSDLYGRKRFFLLGLFVFLLGSTLCGLADSVSQLIVFRGIQGLGAGILMPNTFTMLFTLMPPDRAGKFQGWFMGVFALSSVAGPTIGAFLTETVGWRWNFLLNLPLGMIAFFVLLFALRESKSETITSKVDYVGASLLVVSTVSLLLALKLGGVDYTWSSWQVLTFFILGGIGVVGFAVAERKAEDPIVPFGMYKNKTVSGMISATFLQGVILFGALLYIPMFVQGSLGGDAGETSAVLTPLMIAVMIGAVVSNGLMRMLSWRAIVTLSMLLSALGFAWLALLPLNVNPWHMRIVMAIIGVGVGLLMPVSQTAVVTTVAPNYRGSASSAVTFFRTVGGVIGTAATAAAVNSRLAAVDEVSSSVIANAVHQGFWLLAGVGMLGAFLAWFMGNARFDPSGGKAPVAES